MYNNIDYYWGAAVAIGARFDDIDSEAAFKEPTNTNIPAILLTIHYSYIILYNDPYWRAGGGADILAFFSILVFV